MQESSDFEIPLRGVVGQAQIEFLSCACHTSSPMAWSEITLTVPDALKDAVSGRLSELGVAGIWESAQPGAGDTRLVAYFESPADLEGIREAIHVLFQRAGSVPPVIEPGSVEDQDWGEKWKKSWSSFALGNRFFVIPSWSDSVCPADRFPILIDPGQAFGTGTHETTQLTLEALERWMPTTNPDSVVLDLGTGSGILAIAAKLLGVKVVHACDVDPVALEVASENLDRNTGQWIGLMCGSIDSIAGSTVDLLLCNLTADVIGEILPEIHRAMRSLGIVVFSGILDFQSDDIRTRAGRLGFIVLEEATRGEWCSLVVRKNGR
jgi:ribosomal protein L11 methyltransferase